MLKSRHRAFATIPASLAAVAQFEYKFLNKNAPIRGLKPRVCLVVKSFFRRRVPSAACSQACARQIIGFGC